MPQASELNLTRLQVASAQSQPMTSSLYQTYNATAAQVGFGQCNESSPVVLTTPGKFTLQGEPLTQITDAQAQATTGEDPHSSASGLTSRLPPTCRLKTKQSEV